MNGDDIARATAPLQNDSPLAVVGLGPRLETTASHQFRPGHVGVSSEAHALKQARSWSVKPRIQARDGDGIPHDPHRPPHILKNARGLSTHWFTGQKLQVFLSERSELVDVRCLGPGIEVSHQRVELALGRLNASVHLSLVPVFVETGSQDVPISWSNQRHDPGIVGH